MLLKACVLSDTWKNQAAPPTQPGTSFYCKRCIEQLLFLCLWKCTRHKYGMGGEWSLFEGGVGSRKHEDLDHKAMVF